MTAHGHFSINNGSPLGARLEETGLGFISSVEIVSLQPERFNSYFTTTSYEVHYTMIVNEVNIGTDELEEKLLYHHDYEEMKRIIETNPELKDLYEKYKTIDRLSGDS